MKILAWVVLGIIALLAVKEFMWWLIIFVALFQSCRVCYKLLRGI